MTSEVFSVFVDHVSKYKLQGRILLIVDGHSSHARTQMYLISHP